MKEWPHPEYAPAKQFQLGDTESEKYVPRYLVGVVGQLNDQSKIRREVFLKGLLSSKHKPIQEVCSVVLDYEPHSIVGFLDKWYLCLSKGGANECTDVFLLPLTNLLGLLEETSNDEVEELFFDYFGGMAESIVPDCVMFSKKLEEERNWYFDDNGVEIIAMPVWFSGDGIDFVMFPDGEVFLRIDSLWKYVAPNFNFFLGIYVELRRTYGADWFLNSGNQ